MEKMSQIQKDRVRTSCCPSCGSYETEYSHVQVHQGSCHQPASCYACEYRWSEYYDLSAILDDVTLEFLEF